MNNFFKSSETKIETAFVGQTLTLKNTSYNISLLVKFVQGTKAQPRILNGKAAPPRKFFIS